MSADAAKAVVRRFYTELFRDLASAEECISPDYVDHNNADAGHGPNVLRSHVAALLHTFPDSHHRDRGYPCRGRQGCYPCQR